MNSDINIGIDYRKTLDIIGRTKEAFEDISKGRDFLLNLKKTDSVLCYSHNDGDGLCSAAILDWYLYERKIPHHVSLTEPHHRGVYSQKVKKRIHQNFCNKIIISDLELSRFSKGYEYCKQNNLPLLEIDHHTHLKSRVSDISTYVNLKYPPLNEGPSASALTYKLCKCAGIKKDLLWVALLGSASDKLMTPSLDLLDIEEQTLSTYVRGKQLDPDFNPVVYALNISYYDCGLNKELFNHLKKSIKLNDPLYIWLRKNDETKHVFDVIEESEKELRYWLKNGEKIEDKKANFYFLGTKSNKDIKRLAIGVLSIRKPKYTVATSREDKDLIHFSFRKHSGDLVPILKKATKNIFCRSVGGHSGAGGIITAIKNKSKVIDNIIKILSEENK